MVIVVDVSIRCLVLSVTSVFEKGLSGKVVLGRV
jgi:hypothetical protein